MPPGIAWFLFPNATTSLWPGPHLHALIDIHISNLNQPTHHLFTGVLGTNRWSLGATAVCSLLFSSPSDIVAEGSARSYSNACTWGISATLLGTDLRTTDGPIRPAIESAACPAVCVGLSKDPLLIAMEISASSTITVLLSPLLERPVRRTFDCPAFIAWSVLWTLAGFWWSLVVVRWVLRSGRWRHGKLGMRFSVFCLYTWCTQIQWTTCSQKIQFVVIYYVWYICYWIFSGSTSLCLYICPTLGRVLGLCGTTQVGAAFGFGVRDLQPPHRCVEDFCVSFLLSNEALDS